MFICDYKPKLNLTELWQNFFIGYTFETFLHLLSFYSKYITVTVNCSHLFMHAEEQECYRWFDNYYV